MHFSLHPFLTISMILGAPRSDQDGEQAEEERGRPRPREAHHPAVLLLLRHRSRCDIILGGHHRCDSPTDVREIVPSSSASAAASSVAAAATVIFGRYQEGCPRARRSLLSGHFPPEGRTTLHSQAPTWVKMPRMIRQKTLLPSFLLWEDGRDAPSSARGPMPHSLLLRLIAAAKSSEWTPIDLAPGRARERSPSRASLFTEYR